MTEYRSSNKKLFRPNDRFEWAKPEQRSLNCKDDMCKVIKGFEPHE